jgi:hypothetical protein
MARAVMQRGEARAKISPRLSFSLNHVEVRVYRYHVLETNVQALEPELNILEANGWSLVSISIMPSRVLAIAILRRPQGDSPVEAKNPIKAARRRSSADLAPEDFDLSGLDFS